MRLPDISCGRACYSYVNDDKCEVVLCRVAPGELEPRDATDEAAAEPEDEGLRRAKEVRSRLRLEKVTQPGVVGQVCFAGSCLPRNGYHNAEELNRSKFIEYPTEGEHPSKAADGEQKMAYHMTMATSLTSIATSDSGFPVASSSHSGSEWVRLASSDSGSQVRLLLIGPDRL